MPEMPQKTWWIVVAGLVLVCGYMGFELSQRSQTIDALHSDNAGLTMEKDQLILDLEKMRFAYDTLETENALMVAELAAQQERVESLLKRVRNGQWELSKAQKEAETLRAIMKGYIVTIDSLNQLNLALLDENLAMKEQVEAVAEENAALVERQENMEEMLEAGRTLQVADIVPTGVRILSSGRQRDTDRADRSDMLRVCFTSLENRIAETGKTTFRLRILSSDGTVLPGEEGDGTWSASRTLDYARERIEACIFYTPTSPLPTGTYAVQILHGDTVIGEQALDLR